MEELIIFVWKCQHNALKTVCVLRKCSPFAHDHHFIPRTLWVLIAHIGSTTPSLFVADEGLQHGKMSARTSKA